MDVEFTIATLIEMLSKGLLGTSYDELEIRRLWNTKTMNAVVDDCRKGPRADEFFKLVDNECPYEGDHHYLISRLVAHPKGWPKTLNATKDDLDPLTIDEQDLVYAAHVHELIGDLSEGLLSCSYNEADIRLMWNNNSLDRRVQFYKAEMPHEYQRFQQQMGSEYLVDGNYQDLVTRRIGLAGGWPCQWSSVLKDLDPLTPKEKEMVSTLNIVRSHTEKS